MPKNRLPLAARQQPVQPRAEQSVAIILDTTAKLLDEVGIEAFNTNLLAQRAGIRVRTVYRYFPNKYAIITALTEKLAVQWDVWMSEFYVQIANPETDWRSALAAAAGDWLRNAQRVPGALTVLQAMNATPELTHIHFQILEDMSRKLSAALADRGVKLPAAKLLAVARSWTTSMTAGAELYLKLKGEEAALFLEELNLGQQASLARYIVEDHGQKPQAPDLARASAPVRAGGDARRSRTRQIK